MTSTFRDAPIFPEWLAGVPTQGGTLSEVGKRYLYAMRLQADWLGAKIIEGVRRRFPTYIDPADSQPDGDALTLIGRDRTIPRGPNETNAGYAARCVRWMDDLKLAGSAFVLLDQLAGYLTPAQTTLRVVNNWGIWYTRNPDASRALTISPLVAGVPNWNWDNLGPWQSPGPLFAWSRLWVIIYCNGGSPFDVGPVWGTSSTWAAPNRTWGSTATPQQVSDIRNLCGQFKAAHSKCQNIILAFDPTSFNPAGPNGSPLPDGTWGRWAHPTGSPFSGQQARLPTARYWDGPP